MIYHDYLQEYTQSIAKSFCEFETLTNIEKIQFAISDGNFDIVFRSLFDGLKSRNITAYYRLKNAKAKEFYRNDLKNSIREMVREEIIRNDYKYMLSRFLLIRTLDPTNKYRLFDGEWWYEKAKKVFSEVFENEDINFKKVLDARKEEQEQIEKKLLKAFEVFCN